MASGLTPINKCVLVELAEDLEFIQTPDKQYATKTRGVVIAVSDIGEDLLGKMVYFEDFRDGTQVEEAGKKYAFIKFKDIRGYHE